MARVFLPPLSKMRRALSPNRTLGDVASRRWIVHPEETFASPAAVFIEEELERITGFSAFSSADVELGRIRARSVVRRPVELFELDDVTFCNGDLFAGEIKRFIRGLRRSWAAWIDADVDDGGVLCSSWLGLLYFGHWLAEDEADRIRSAEFGPASVLRSVPTPHKRAYTRLFGTAAAELPDTCHVRRLRFVETELCCRYRDEPWAAMTRAIERSFPAEPHVGCMLLRGGSGTARLLVNEAEVAAHLHARGFRIVDPQSATLEEILTQASGSRIVVGVEGSQLAHGFHCLPADGRRAFLVLQPPNRFGCIDKERCDRKGALYGFSIGRPAGDGFAIDLASVDRVLDELLERIERRPQNVDASSSDAR